MDVRNFRLAVASRALGVLPQTISKEAAQALAASVRPQVIRERCCALELLLAAVVVGVLLGWMLEKVMRGRR